MLMNQPGFILGGDELVATIENNFGELKKDSDFAIQTLTEVYQSFSELIKNLFSKINTDFQNLNKIISIHKEENSNLLTRMTNIENENSKLQEEFVRSVSENKETENFIISMKNENNNLKLKLKLQNNKTSYYEKEIQDLYYQLSNFIKANLEK